LDPHGVIRHSNDERAERDHELCAALFGIESTALGLTQSHDRLTTAQVFELTTAMAAEARRLRALLHADVEQPPTFDLADAIRPVIVSARSLGLDVHAAVPPGIEVCGRRHDTAQVVFALLDNAHKHASPSPVDIRVTVNSETTTMYVEDYGKGICAQIRERVFERGVVDEHSGGSGLGLFIARRLMVDQGGSLSVHSRTCGGTLFKLVLHTARSSCRRELRSIPVLPAVSA
jgi:signal transduction histidine kinase